MTEAQLEAAYWTFDTARAGRGRWAGRPQSERDAFKLAIRYTLGDDTLRDERGPTAVDGAGNIVSACAMDGCRGCGNCQNWSSKR